jgi:hypothetical protein
MSNKYQRRQKATLDVPCEPRHFHVFTILRRPGQTGFALVLRDSPHCFSSYVIHPSVFRLCWRLTCIDVFYYPFIPFLF